MQIPPTIRMIVVLCCLLPGFPVLAADDWSFKVTPYIWIADVELETELPDLPSSAPDGASRFESRISGGAMMAAEMRYRSIGLFIDFDWLRVDTEARNPEPAFSSVDLQSDFFRSTAALSYQLRLKGPLHAELLAGGRVWYVTEELDANAGSAPGFESSVSNNWLDPVVGANLRYDLTERWSLITRGNVGGHSTSFGWEVTGGLSYRFSELCSGALGYRYLHQDFERNRFNLDTDIQGLILGFGFHF